MTGRWVYPRLSDEEADLRLQAMIEGTSEELEEPNAAPFETGTVASPDKIDEVREAVIEAAKPWGNGEVKRSEVAEWDAAVGQALYESMDIVPADAAHRGVWAYLTLVLLPEVQQDDSLNGTANECWGISKRLLPDLVETPCPKDVEVPEGVQRLGEDELVGIFEGAAASAETLFGRSARFHSPRVQRCEAYAVRSRPLPRGYEPARGRSCSMFSPPKNFDLIQVIRDDPEARPAASGDDPERANDPSG